MDENFDIRFDLSDGQVYRYKGESVTDFAKMEPIPEDDWIRWKDLFDDSVDRNPSKWVRITLNRVNFGPNDYVLTSEEREKLDVIASEVARHKDKVIKIVGHTADYGSFAGREALSIQRATVVRDYFVEQGALDKEAVENGMVLIEAKGAEELVDTSGTKEGDALNRRVEIYIMVGN